MTDQSDMFGDIFPENVKQELVADAAEGDPGEAGEAEVLAKARREHEAMVANAGEVVPPSTGRGRNVTPLPLPVCIIYPSRSGNQTPHIVTLALWHCTCEAAMLGNRECWAIGEAKRLFGDRR